MDILSFGMKMEQDGQAFYEEHAARLNDRNASEIFTYLANEEQKHYEYIKKFREGSRELPESRLVKDVKNVFENMRERKEAFVAEKASMLEVLNKGMEMEDKSIEFYKDRAEASESSDDRDIFLLLKKQEDKHYALLCSLIDYYDRPAHWLEDAEFFKSEDF